MAGERRRAPTRTSAFGVSRRESHDATGFYRRFEAPMINGDDTVVACPVKDLLFAGDSRDMSALPDSCIALMVTSPPYLSA
jgi:site-specific DNA-methyltransferase (adenine-specific)